MEFAHTFTTVDAHAAGEPLRIVTGGVPRLQGDTILAKRRWARDHIDHVRRALIHEPRGHADMYGAYVTEPERPDSDFGVVFMHNEGYSTMCGHGIIALASVAVAQGMVARSEPETRIGIDSPAGFIETFVAWDGHRVGGVRFRNVPSFLFARDVHVATPTFGDLVCDVAYGGAFYAYLDGAQADLRVRPENLASLVRLGDEVKHAVEATMHVVHPLEPELEGIYGAIIHGDPRDPAHDQANVCIFADREVDRSPTGTGTAGRVAQLVARGELELGRPFANESIVGTVFTGTALERTTVADLPAVVPEISGHGFITGFNQWVVDPDDPVADGFFLR